VATKTGALAGPATVSRVVERIAVEAGVEPRSLRVRALLHLPRLSSRAEDLDEATIEAEVRRLVERISPSVAARGSWVRGPEQPPAGVRELRLIEDREIADELFANFHYLGSPRRDGSSLLACAEAVPAAAASISPMDLPHLERAAGVAGRAEAAAVVSRVFAFDWVPRNTVSYLLGRLRRRLAEQAPHTEVLVTYVNPNLGFDAASLRADNWRLVAREHGTRYAYLDGDYVTDRQLSAAFGSTDPDHLRRRLGDRLTFSRWPLLPLDVYGLSLDHRVSSRLPEAPLEVSRL